MAKNAGYIVFCFTALEAAIPGDEPELALPLSPPVPGDLEMPGSKDTGRARRVFWPYVRIPCRSFVRGNC
jgi:hypothetical protein